jgi:hypothetical protein
MREIRSSTIPSTFSAEREGNVLRHCDVMLAPKSASAYFWRSGGLRESASAKSLTTASHVSANLSGSLISKPSHETSTSLIAIAAK